MTRVFHWIGVAFIFIASILLLITTISAPVIKDIAILKVMLTNQTDIRHSSVTFGAFGHCILDVPPVTTDQDLCFPKVIGYKPARIMEEIDHTTFSSAGSDSADALTNAFVLHPVACGLAFIAGLVALGGVIGGLIGTLIAAVAWIITLVVMAIDFAAFGIIKNHVNSDGSGSHAYYSIGMWTTLAAMVLLFFGMILVFFTCCSERRKNRGTRKSHRNTAYAADGYAGGSPGYETQGMKTHTTRRHF